MRTLIAIVLVVAGIGLVSSADALPLATLNQIQDGLTIQVYDGCGWGRHRGPFGACRPLYNCPPGWHPGPFGRRCFRD
jgi:hypothetical protein